MINNNVTYEIHDTFGAPQAGCEVIPCETWEEVDDYFDDADALDRLEMGYARIVEVY